MNTKLTQNEIKQRQIEILRFFKSTCENLGLWYSLAYGTMLGAVRHGGYIPWDDDIDVCMPRKDYDLLITALNKQQHNRFKLLEFGNNRTYYQNFAKIVDSETIFVRHDKSIKTIDDYGINIDIFPLDNCPNDEVKFLKNYSKIQKWDEFKYLTVTKGRVHKSSVIKTVAANILKVFCDIIGCGFFIKKIEKCIKTYNTTNTGLVCAWTVAPSFKKTIPTTQLYGNKTIIYENENYCCFNNPDQYLTNLYGDYMTPPPENQRIPPHGYDAYLKDGAPHRITTKTEA